MFANAMRRLESTLHEKPTESAEMDFRSMPAIVLLSSAGNGYVPLAEVESTYWDCEFAAGQVMPGSADIDICGAAFEQLKKHKFQGDFYQFLAWWNENKHRELARRRGQGELAGPRLND